MSIVLSNIDLLLTFHKKISIGVWLENTSLRNNLIKEILKKYCFSELTKNKRIILGKSKINVFAPGDARIGLRHDVVILVGSEDFLEPNYYKGCVLCSLKPKGYIFRIVE